MPTLFYSQGNIYTIDPVGDLVSGTYVLSIGYGTSIEDSAGAVAIPSVVVFSVDDARVTAAANLSRGLAALGTPSDTLAILTATEAAATGVTNNLLSVIPAMMSAGISAASNSSSKQTVISSLLGAIQGAASLTSTADRTITRINDTANFTTLLGLISNLLVAQAVAGNLTASELGSAVTTVNDSLATAGADSGQVALFQSSFFSGINVSVAAEPSLDGSYAGAIWEAVALATGVGITYSLTTAVDSFTGTSGNDSFNATVFSSLSTLNAGDVLNGGAGTDTLAIVTLDGPGTITDFSTSGIEVISVITVSDYTVDLANTTGVTNITLDGTGSATFINAPSGVQTQNKGYGNLQITYR